MTRTGQGETPYNYFKLFLETVSAFPSIGMCLTTYYSAHPAIITQSLATLFPHLENMKDYILKSDPGTPFSGSAHHGGTKGKGRNNKKKGNNQPAQANPRTQATHPSLEHTWSHPTRSHLGTRTRPHRRLCPICRRNSASAGYADGTGPKPVSRRTVRYAGFLPPRHRVLHLLTP